jgi:hypothetical protein
MTFTPSDIKESAIRLDNDINGNPRYYFPRYVWPKMDDKTRRNTGFFTLYRGKRYGAGYVMTSYNLDMDIEYALCAILNKN